MQIQHEIIKALRDAEGHPLLLSVLHAQVNARVRPRPHKGVFDAAIQNLLTKAFILQTDNELEEADPFIILGERGEAYAVKTQL